MNCELEVGVEMESVGGTTVLLAADGGAAVLNSTASEMLKSFIACEDMEQIINHFASRFETDEKTLMHDMREVRDQLMGCGMLRVSI